ncbi:MAG: PH domain-containing protein [Acidimicrobiia bacterium]|nr:PH domain-containing protein [Acidimicrobiia bacterium]
MGYPERLLSPGEEVVAAFRPHWQFLAFPAALGLAAVALAVVAVVTVDGGAGWLIVAGLVAVWLLLSVKRVADWLTTSYVITNERVVRRSGVFSRSGVEIPLESITNVAFSQTLVERIVRSGDLVIESAGETGQSRYSDIPDPEGLQSLIYQQREARTRSLRTESGTGNSVASELERLADLRDRGVLTDEEFERQKQRLLGE